MNYNKIANSAVAERTTIALNNKGYKVIVSKNKIEALEKLKESLPAGVSIMNGASTTLDQIGFTDYLKTQKHQWQNKHEEILKETDVSKQQDLRKMATISDFYVGSVHALVENGEFIIASNTGSQLPNIVYSSNNLIFVVSTKKIVPTLEEAMLRLENHVIPLENTRVQKAYGVPSTSLNKLVIFKGENPMMGRTITFILVEEDLGF